MRENLMRVLAALKVPGIISYFRNSFVPGHITILCLHRIHPSSNPFWSPIHPQLFEQLLKYIKKHYAVIGFRDLDSSTPYKKPLLILSFDDGYKDFIEYALPLLEKYDCKSNHNIVVQCAQENKPIWTQLLVDQFTWMKTNDWRGRLPLPGHEDITIGPGINWQTVFLSTLHRFFSMSQKAREKVLADWQDLNKSSYERCAYMNWGEVRYCAERGVEIGCHTWSHDVLFHESDVEVLYKETVLARQEIKKNIGKEVDLIALPNGQAGEAVLHYLENTEYKKILVVGDHILLQPGQRVIPRINMVQEPFSEMKLRVSGFHSIMNKPFR